MVAVRLKTKRPRHNTRRVSDLVGVRFNRPAAPSGGCPRSAKEFEADLKKRRGTSLSLAYIILSVLDLFITLNALNTNERARV